MGFLTPWRVTVAERTSTAPVFHCAGNVICASLTVKARPRDPQNETAHQSCGQEGSSHSSRCCFVLFFFFFLSDSPMSGERSPWWFGLLLGLLKCCQLPRSQAPLFTPQLFLPPLGVTGHRAPPQSFRALYFRYRTERKSTKQQQEWEG